jgi:hypothetical protein
VAYRYVAAVADAHQSIAATDVASYALQGLEGGGGTSGSDVPREIASRFAESRPLDDFLDRQHFLNVDRFDRAVRAYLSDQLRRYAKAKGLPVSEICDKSERTLRGWNSAGNF